MSDQLDNLQSQIREAQKTNPDFKSETLEPTDDSQATNMGLRAVTDLLGTPIVCGAIGMGLDHWFGSKPIAFMILAFLGVIAGFYNLYRASQGLDSSVGLKSRIKALQSAPKKDRNTTFSE